MAKRTAKFVEKSSSGSSNRNRNRNRVGESSRGEEQNNDGEEQRNQDPQKDEQIDRLAWEINTKEFNKQMVKFRGPGQHSLVRTILAFLTQRHSIQNRPWGNLMEDINVKFEADGQQSRRTQRWSWWPFAIERLKKFTTKNRD